MYNAAVQETDKSEAEKGDQAKEKANDTADAQPEKNATKKDDKPRLEKIALKLVPAPMDLPPISEVDRQAIRKVFVPIFILFNENVGLYPMITCSDCPISMRRSD